MPGGVSVNLGGYGNIQDLDFDSTGTLWVHQGNSGDFSTVDLSTGIATSRFIGPAGSQGMTFRPSSLFSPTETIAMAAAFFNSGTFATGAYMELDPLTGAIVCYGPSATSSQLPLNEDPCVLTPSAFSIVNGLTWIDATNELAITSFSVVGGYNVARFAPESTAYVGAFGTDAIRADGSPFRLTFTGDAVIGGTGFSIGVENVWPGDTVLWGISTMPDCTAPPVGANGSAVYLDLTPSNLFYWTTINAPGPSLVVNVSTATVPPSAMNLELFTQFAGTDLGASGFPLLLTRAARVRFGLQ